MFSRVTFAGLALNFLAIPLMARGADRRDGGGAAGARVSRRRGRAAGWIAHLGAAGLVRSADLVRFAPALHLRVAPPSWIVVAVYYVALASRGAAGGARARSAVADAGARVACARRRGRRALDCSPSRGRCRGARRRPAARHVSRRRAGRLGVRRLSARRDAARRCRRPVRRRRRSTSATASSRRCCATPASAGSTIVALTHGDPDHIGGAASILREFRPREVWEGIPVPRFEPLTRAAAGGAGGRRAVGERLARRSRSSIDGVEVDRAASGARRLGAAAGAQRRLDRPRAALARRLGAADRRHRQGRRTRRRRRDPARARCASSRSRTTAA